MKTIWKKGNLKKYIILLIFLLAGTVYFYFSSFGKSAVVVKERVTEDGGTIVQLEDSDTIDLRKEFPDDMSENAIMNTIHKMSHQKVVADKKWGAIPLTPQRVNRLLEIVYANPVKYKNVDIYIRILERWAEGDFSRVASDHNAIWNLQGGTIGRAVGVATVEEEKEFIAEHFRVSY